MHEFDDRVICRLVIQPSRAVWRDTISNRRWLAGMFGAIAVVLLASAGIASLLGDGFVISQAAEGAVTQKVVTLDYWTALYFTLINSTTVGFGDIFPITPAARALAIFNAVFGVLIFASFVSVALMALQPSSPAEGHIDASPLARIQQDTLNKFAEATVREHHARRVWSQVHGGLAEIRSGLRALQGRDRSHLLTGQDLPVDALRSVLRAIEGLIASVVRELNEPAERDAIRTKVMMEASIDNAVGRSGAAERRRGL